METHKRGFSIEFQAWGYLFLTTNYSFPVILSLRINEGSNQGQNPDPTLEKSIKSSDDKLSRYISIYASSAVPP